MVSKKEKHCKRCGKESYGLYCRECTKIGHYGHIGTWKHSQEG
jgi:ribosomal protein L37E